MFDCIVGGKPISFGALHGALHSKCYNSSEPHACCRNHIGLTFNEQTTMVDLTTWYCTIALLWIPPPVNKCSN